jgi:hypothetical protein
MEYKGSEDTSGNKEVIFDGNSIPEVPYTPSCNSDLSWGYKGAGPTNTARSILEHAQDQGVCENIDPEKHQQDFRDDFLLNKKKADTGWTISLSDIEQWCKNR